MQTPITTNGARKMIQEELGTSIQPNLSFVQQCFTCTTGNAEQKGVPKLWEPRPEMKKVISETEVPEMTPIKCY